MTMIGIEVHCQLNTETKLFCGDASYSSIAGPNENTCPVCMGFPGYKPVINKKALDYTILAGLAMRCSIADVALFSRKTYFYPDLAKNYQITQYEKPIAEKGELLINDQRIRIRRIHLEEDPAQLVYNGSMARSEYTMINYNRSGAPLIEIVTEPDFKSPKEVRLFLEKLSSILEHLGIYDPTRDASLRVDANISTTGERVELKNITGFENVEKALAFEVVRQNGMARMGEAIQRETRHFDPSTGTTRKLRAKETEEDYGYIFDPDLPVISISREWADSIRKGMPELPDIRISRFVSQYRLTEYEARVLVYYDKNLADFFEECCRLHGSPKELSGWISNYLIKSLNWRSERIRDSKARPETFVELLDMVDKGEITERYAKELIKEYVDTGVSPRKLAGKGRMRVNQEELKTMIKKTLNEEVAAVEQLKSGRQQAMQFLIGKILSLTGKQADPKLIRDMIKAELEN